MVNSLSPYFTDEDLITQLQLQFDYDEKWDMDFKTVFNLIEDRENDFYLKLRGNEFSIDKITGEVSVIGGDEEE